MMNANRSNPETMDPAAALRKLFDNPWFATVLALSMFYILPHWGEMVMSVVFAGGFLALVALFPDRFRNRKGSLSTALWLTGALWAMAALVGVIT